MNETYSGGLTKIPREKSGVRVFLIGGFVFLSAVPALLLLGAFLTREQGEFLKGLFPFVFVILAAVSASAGLVVVLVSGFILIVRAVPDPTHGTDILGTAAPQQFRPHLSSRTLDLRFLWFPILVLLCVFTAVRFLARASVIPQDVFVPAVAFGLEAAEVAAFILFFFFWLAGVARLNRAGSALPYSAFTWPALALCAFSLPFVFL